MEKLKITPLRTTFEIQGEINNETYEDFEKKIKNIRSSSYQLNINVTGGYDIPTKKLVKLIQDTNIAQCKRTLGLDNVLSSGIYAFLTGEERICHHRTKFLFHRHFDRVTKKINPNLSETEIFLLRFFCQRTYLPLQKALNLMNENNGKGRVLKAYEAKQYGIVHEIW